jgi:hypothetical protein
MHTASPLRRRLCKYLVSVQVQRRLLIFCMSKTTDMRNGLTWDKVHEIVHIDCEIVVFDNSSPCKVTLENGLARETFTTAIRSKCEDYVVVQIWNPLTGELSHGQRVENGAFAVLRARESVKTHRPQLADIVPCVYA